MTTMKFILLISTWCCLSCQEVGKDHWADDPRLFQELHLCWKVKIDDYDDYNADNDDYVAAADGDTDLIKTIWERNLRRLDKKSFLWWRARASFAPKPRKVVTKILEIKCWKVLQSCQKIVKGLTCMCALCHVLGSLGWSRPPGGKTVSQVPSMTL